MSYLKRFLFALARDWCWVNCCSFFFVKLDMLMLGHSVSIAIVIFIVISQMNNVALFLLLPSLFFHFSTVIAILVPLLRFFLWREHSSPNRKQNKANGNYKELHLTVWKWKCTWVLVSFGCLSYSPRLPTANRENGLRCVWTVYGSRSNSNSFYIRFLSLELHGWPRFIFRYTHSNNIKYLFRETYTERFVSMIESHTH